MRGLKLKVDGDGAERLDFTYIDDLVEGVGLAIEKPEARNQIFNLTYGWSRSISEMIEITRRYFPEVQARRGDKLMPARGTLSIDKARRLLGFEPKNPVDIGFPKYIEWYKSMMQQTHGRVLPLAKVR